jgi:PAS domain S-box-containing protein
MKGAHEISKPVASTKRSFILWISTLAILVMGLLYYSQSVSSRLIQRWAPLSDAATQIKLEAAMGHLWFEEIIAGDTTRDISTVWHRWDRSAWYATAMLEGGENRHGVIVPLSDPILRREINDVLDKIRHFRTIARERWESPEQSGIGTDIDQRYHAVFLDFLDQADRVEIDLQLAMAAGANQLHATQVLLMVLCVGLAVLVGAIFWRYERRQAVETDALEQSERKLSFHLQNTPIAAIEWNLDFEVVEWNTAAESIFGYTREEALGRHGADLIIPESARPDTSEVWKGLVENKGGHHSINENCTKEGRTIVCDWYNTSLTDQSGNVIGVAALVRDITERDEAETKLRESEALLRRIAENYPNSYISIIEEDFTVGFTSGQEFKNQGLDPEQFVGMTLDQVLGDQAGTVRKHYERCFKGDEHSFELRINDQTQLYRSVPLYSVDGTITRILVVVENITERRQLENERDRAGRFLQTVIDGFPENLIVINRDYTIALANQTLRDTTKGLDPVAACMKCHQVSHNSAVPCGGDDEPCPLKTVFATKAPVTVEHIHCDADGHSTFIEVVAAPIFDEEGEVVQVIETYRDITERKRAEANLTDSEEKFRLLTEKSVMGVFIIQDGKMAYVNESLASTFGYRPEEIIGKLSPKDLIHEVDTDFVTRKLKERLDGHVEKDSILYRGVKKDGSIVHIEVYARLIEYSGHPAIIGTLTDVTEQHQAVEALRESEERFQKAFSTSPNAISITRVEDGCFIEVNDSFQRIFGYSREGAIGKSVLDLGIYPDGSARRKLIQRLSEEGRIADHEMDLHTKTGEKRRCLVSMELIQLKEESYVLTTANDITERKLAEQELLRSKILLESSLESQVDTIILSLDRDYRYLYFNEAHSGSMKNEYGTTPELGMCLFDIMKGDEDVEKVKAHYDRALAGESHVVTEEYGEGDLRAFFEISYNPIYDDDQKIIGLCSFAQDITERKQAEEKMREQQYYLTEAQEIGSIGTWELDLIGNRLVWTDENYRIFGVPLGTELSYDTFIKRIHPGDREYVNREWTAAVDGKPYDIEHRLIVDGRIKWVRERAYIRLDEDGRAVSATGITQDITKQKLAQDALQESEERFRQLFENAPLGYQSVDKKGNFIEVNETWCKLLGYTKEEVIGRNFSEFIHPDFKEQFEKNFPKFKNMGYILGVEFEMIRKDGSEVIVSLDGKIGHNEDGSFKQTHCVLKDITESKKAQEELENFFNLAPDLIAVCTTEGGFLRVNPAWEKVLGYTQEELLELGWAKLIHPDDLERTNREAQGRPSGTTVANFVNRNRCKDGSYKTLEWQVAFARDGIIHATARDITERRRNEQDLAAHREQLESMVAERTGRIKAVFQSVKDAIISVDNSLEVMSVNDSVRDIFGKEEQEMVGSNFRDIQIPGHKACLGVLEETVSSGKSIREFRTEWSLDCGARRIAELDCSPLFEEGAQVKGAVLVVRDISRVIKLEQELVERHSFHNIIGRSKSLQDIYRLLENLTEIEADVLITGESGTGKGLIANALHFNSDRSSSPMVEVNCSVFAENLLESELFGHVKGAFTGAIKDKIGRFQLADGGTLFLDEIGDISPAIQLKLLRVIQDRKYERVGDSTTLETNARVIAATNRNLKELVRQGKFREDLYYRLKVVEITAPPLRERTEDVPLLVRHFCDRFADSYGKDIKGVTNDVLQALTHYSWPGNIRELQHIIERCFVVCSGTVITMDHLPEEILDTSQAETLAPAASSIPRSKLILKTLEKTDWNKAKAARQLGISRATLYRWISNSGVDQSEPEKVTS